MFGSIAKRRLIFNRKCQNVFNNSKRFFSNKNYTKSKKKIKGISYAIFDKKQSQFNSNPNPIVTTGKILFVPITAIGIGYMMSGTAECSPRKKHYKLKENEERRLENEKKRSKQLEKDRMYFKNDTYQDFVNRYKKNSNHGKEINYYNHDVQLEVARTYNYSTFACIKNPSIDVQIAYVVSGHSDRIKNIKDPDERVQIAAITKNYYALHYIENPTEKAQLTAIRQNWHAISCIKNPTEKAQLFAVKKNENAYSHIVNPTPIIQTIIIQQNWEAIKNTKNPTDEAIELATSMDWEAIMYVDKLTEKAKQNAVNNAWEALMYIENPNNELKQIAAKQGNDALQYVMRIDNDFKLKPETKEHEIAEKTIEQVTAIIGQAKEIVNEKVNDASINIATNLPKLKQVKEIVNEKVNESFDIINQTTSDTKDKINDIIVNVSTNMPKLEQVKENVSNNENIQEYMKKTNETIKDLTSVIIEMNKQFNKKCEKK